MKTCSILISNYNSYEAIQLCLESVHRNTDYPYELVVYDDCSTNKVDLEYLRDQRNIGWIELIESKKRLKHGGALNVLLNHCNTELAMILDCDIEILQSGWLKEMVDLVDDKTLIVTGIEKDYNSAQPSLPDWFRSWFMMINMKAYRDGMEVDWNTASGTDFDGKQRFYPVGGRLWLKLLFDNPKKYKLVSIPDYIERKFHHFAHVSILGTLADNEPNLEDLKRAQNAKFDEVKNRLMRLRSQ